MSTVVQPPLFGGHETPKEVSRDEKAAARHEKKIREAKEQIERWEQMVEETKGVINDVERFLAVSASGGLDANQWDGILRICGVLEDLVADEEWAALEADKSAWIAVPVGWLGGGGFVRIRFAESESAWLRASIIEMQCSIFNLEDCCEALRVQLGEWEKGGKM